MEQAGIVRSKQPFKKRLGFLDEYEMMRRNHQSVVGGVLFGNMLSKRLDL